MHILKSFYSRQKGHLSLLLACGACIYPVFLFGDILSGWWRFDDTQLLKFVLDTGLWPGLSEPAAWQKLTVANFTPWILLTYCADLSLFGLQPTFFYLHHLLAIVALAAISIIFLRQWCDWCWAALGTVLFLTGASMTALANQLMTRHYLEGLFLFVLSSLLFRKGLRTEKIVFSFLGAGAYFLAMSAKETYVMLIVALIFWPEDRLKNKKKHVVPFCISLLVYAFWRIYMLGGQMGGYGIFKNTLVAPELLTRMAQETTVAIIGDGLLAVAGLGLISSFILVSSLRKPKVLIFLLAWGFALFLPLLPVVQMMHGPGRYFLLVWWSLAMGLTIALSLGWKRNTFTKILNPVLLGFVFLLIGVNNLQFTTHFQEFIHPHEKVGRKIWNIDDQQSVFYVPEIGFGAWYLPGLVWMKDNFASKAGPAAVLADPVELNELEKKDFDLKTVWKYNKKTGKMVDISSTVSLLIEKWKEGFRSEHLSMYLHRSNHVLTWELGPYVNGRYKLISRDKNNVSGSVFLPRSGKRRVSGNMIHQMRLKYNSPQGWYTYSPWLEYDPGQEEAFFWQRKKGSCMKQGTVYPSMRRKDVNPDSDPGPESWSLL